MDNPTTKAMDYANIRTTIRQIVFPLIQAIYDENPSDIILFCSGHFNSLLQKRESGLQNTNTNYSGERSEVEEELPKIIESREIFPVNLQESTSDPVLTTNSRPESVSLAGRKKGRSWDTPSNILEPPKPVVFLEDVACGIGDQPSLAENQMGLENDAKAGDADIHLKEDSAYEDESFSEYMIADEIKNDSAVEDLNSPQCCRENTPDAIESLCVQFEGMKTEMPDTLKLNDSRYEDFDQDTAPKEDNKISRKKLSPNSSFGFVSHLNEYDSEEEVKKIDSEDSHSENVKTKAEEISMIGREVSQSLHGLAEKISCAESNFNDTLKKAKEISDVIQSQNNVDSTNKSDEMSECREDFIGEKKNGKISNISEKYDDVTDRNKADAKKTDDVPITFKVDYRNMPAYLNPEEKEYKETKREYQEETFPNEEISLNTAWGNYDEDDPLWRKKYYEAITPLDNLNNSSQRRDRLFRSHFLTRKPNIGEGGDVPLDRIYISNEFSNDYMSNRSRNQISSESSADAREFSHSRLSSDEISHRSNSARSSDKLSERKSASEEISNANPNIIPYWWRNTCKQSHSSENVVHSSTGLQTKLKEETRDSTKSEREKDVSSFNEAGKSYQMNKNEQEDIFFEASDEIHCNRGIKESKERKYEDKNKEVVSSETLNDESLNIADTQQEILSETDLPDKIQSKYDTSIHNESVPETSNETQNSKQCVTNGDEVVEKKHTDHCGISFDARKDKEVNRNNNHPMEDECGLNSASGCGDFVYATNNANMQNSSSQTDMIEPDENITSEQSDGGISLEYFEEVMERVIEQQINDSMYSYEGLDFSNDTEDESSCVESSDFSETDDCSMNDSMQDK